MRSLSKALRANCSSGSSGLSGLRAPYFNTCLHAPPSSVIRRSFTTTPPQHRFQPPKRKQQKQQSVGMAPEMTTLKGKPFDRASLESLMRASRPTAATLAACTESH
jgi:glycyl-tRNA synthetase